MNESTDKTSPKLLRPDLLRNPAQLLAFGFGSGLAPRAPGTVGTLAAIPLYLLIADWSLFAYTVFVLVAGIAGVWICAVAGRQLQVHDHPGIVWDEFVGFWITMWAVPPEFIWIVCGFVVFRVLDVVKPWPIGMLDRQVHGGIGVMADDAIAGVLACITLHLAIGVT
ncbi:MAG: phosphatidylglycerophosphatase A [Gammaproteobacteria bacterium]|nr:phosphatidylglycerophosphatase A [Gammaproteobacteria bacterium]